MYALIKRFYYLFYRQLYHPELDVEYNEAVFKSIGFDIDGIRDTLSQQKLDYYSYTISWHYHLFSGFSLRKEPLNILEIGTHRAEFTRFLAQSFPDSIIHTVELPDDDPFFIGSYERDLASERASYIGARDLHLGRHSNIKFNEMDSFHLLAKFPEGFFDLIWVDGDHLYPQVAIDIFQSFRLIKDTGFFCVDDIVQQEAFKETLYGWNEGYKSIKNLTERGFIESRFIRKRANGKRKNKYIAICNKAIFDSL